MCTPMADEFIIINTGAIILGVGAPPMQGGNIIFVTQGEAALQQENLAVEVEAALLSILLEVEVLAEAEI